MLTANCYDFVLDRDQGKFLVGDQPLSKLITFSNLIRRELLLEIFGHLQIKYELVVKLCIKLMTNSLQTHTSDWKFQIWRDLNLMINSYRNSHQTQILWQKFALWLPYSQCSLKENPKFSHKFRLKNNTLKENLTNIFVYYLPF
jgi:hypothetical protein